LEIAVLKGMGQDVDINISYHSSSCYIGLYYCKCSFVWDYQQYWRTIN